MKTRPGWQPWAPVSGVRWLCLAGFMGAGKTSVGLALSRILGWPFEDLDQRIQSREGRTIAEIFHQSGEAAFRRAEHAALRELLADLGSSPRILALGGGAFALASNRALLEQAGTAMVFLDAPVEELFRRCQQEGRERPLRVDLEQFGRLYQARRPAYLAAALRVETGGKDVEAVAQEVARTLGFAGTGER
jgi:shikimate kinase